MQVAFITEIEDVLHRLERLEERANQNDSSFKYAIGSAAHSIKTIRDQYHEVLHEDARSDTAYRPPLKEV